MAESIRGNKTLSGTWGELWIDGEKIFEFSKIELKVTANREDVQIGIDVDSKITGLKGEGSYTVKGLYQGKSDPGKLEEGQGCALPDYCEAERSGCREWTDRALVS